MVVKRIHSKLKCGLLKLYNGKCYGKISKKDCGNVRRGYVNSSHPMKILVYCHVLRHGFIN